MEAFRRELEAQLSRAEKQGRPHVEINAGELHRVVSPHENRHPMACNAMREIPPLPGDEVIKEPPAGDGASLTIRYILPRSGDNTGREIEIRDVTSDVQRCLSTRMNDAMDALTTLNKYFVTRETKSAALGEISEVLIEAYTGGRRQNPNTRGNDIIKGDQRIEVKSRVIGRWGDDLMFDFSKHTEQTDVAYCVAWDVDDTERPTLQHVFQVGVPFLIARWGTRNQSSYCARTTLGKLKAALASLA